MSDLTPAFEWSGTSSDPNDEQFGDVIERCSMGGRTQSGDAVEQRSLDEADRYDAVIVGEPYDGAVIGRKGAAAGPRALREALAGTKTHHFAGGPVGRIGDLGDVVLPSGADVRGTQEAVAETTRGVHALDALPVFLGGDNSLTFPNAAPLLDSGSLGVINFDAHLDVREVRGDATSGTPYRQLFEAGLDAYACVGARHFETSTAYAEYVAEQGRATHGGDANGASRGRGGEIVTAETVGDDPSAAVDRAVDAMGDVDAIYVSVDLDVLDATAAPGVSAPTPGGLATRELFRMLRELAGESRVVGFEVVECAPPLDTDGRTAAAGARAVAHFLSGRAAEGSA